MTKQISLIFTLVNLEKMVSKLWYEPTLRAVGFFYAKRERNHCEQPSAFPSSMRELVAPHVMHFMPSSFVNIFFAGRVSVQKNQNVSHPKRKRRFNSHCIFALILRKWLRCFNGEKNAISSRLLCSTTVNSAFYSHGTKKPTKCFKGGVYRIALCLNAAALLVSACVQA